MSAIRTTRRGLFAACLAGAAAPGATPLKIESVQAYPVPLLPASRFGTPNFQSDYDPARWRWFGPFSQLAGSILVEIHTDQGITGYGLGGGGGAGAYIVNNHLRDLLVGANAVNIELLWDQMFASTSFYGRRGLAIMAISGVDLALWDIAGKHAGKPVYQLLGGATKEKVAAYATGNDVERALGLGFHAFKLSVPDGVAQGAEGKGRTVSRLKEARAAIGPDKLLMIDCLARWDVDYTLEMAERLAEVDLNFIEEPLYPDDIAGYERLCAEVRSTRIASGEHEYTRFGFQELIRHKAADILQPDITWSGGLTELRRIAALASAASLPLMPHRGGSLYGIHLVLAAPNCDMAESFGTGEPGNELMEAMTAPFKDGHYYPPEKPGFGVDLGDAVLRKYRSR
jgi:L-rhamnonate dehydratase